MKYEKPIVKINEEFAEGVYAASGATCWIIDKNGETNNIVNSDDSREFQFDAHHYSIDAGHAPDSVWVVTFSQPVTSVVSCSGMNTNVIGSTVKIFRSWENMNQNEQWGFALRVSCSSPETLTIVSSYIGCNF